MENALAIVNRFLKLTNHEKNLKEVATLLADNIAFVGPLLRTTGVKAYLSLLEQFLPCHLETHVLKQFENGNDVCSINELVLKTPQNTNITLVMAEWFRFERGKIAEHRVYYDPRDFATAFGMNK